jgi:hypothetical protein
MKQVIVFLAMFAITLSVGGIAASAAVIDSHSNADDSEEMTLRWTNIEAIILDMSFSGNSVTCTGKIRGYSNVIGITATFTLKQVNSNGTLATLKTWSRVSSSTSILNFSGTYSPVNAGQTYRLEVSATVRITGGATETVNGYIDKTYN